MCSNDPVICSDHCFLFSFLYIAVAVVDVVIRVYILYTLVFLYIPMMIGSLL